MSHKFLISVMIILFFVGLSESLGTDSPDLSNFSNRKNSFYFTQSYDDFSKEKIDQKLDSYTVKLNSLKEQWEVCDSLWETFDRLQAGENNEFSQSLNMENLYNYHQKIIWEMVALKEEIKELKNRKSVLNN